MHNDVYLEVMENFEGQAEMGEIDEDMYDYYYGQDQEGVYDEEEMEEMMG